MSDNVTFILKTFHCKWIGSQNYRVVRGACTKLNLDKKVFYDP